jgi:hypothetical protein
METKPNDDTRIAEINKDIGYIKGFIAEIRADVKALDGKYVTQEQLRELNDHVIQIAAAQKEQINRQTGIQRYVPALASSVLSAIMVFLIISFLNSVK